jgi:predicted AAA+ superfamily ATPase
MKFRHGVPAVYKRSFDPSKLLERRSLFLLGPRQTGKSTLLRQNYPNANYIDLLEADTFRRLSLAPEALRELVSTSSDLVIIDEVQKLPELLDEVQRLIDRNQNLRFILTGSSARKLKRGHANLLGGRAFFCNLHPLVTPELGGSRVIDRINNSGLPSHIDSPLAQQELQAYVGTYLKEEIQAEGLTRSIGNFSRVLETAAFSNTEIINYTKIGNDAQVAPRTIQNYFSVLQDTLIVHLLEPYRKTKSRKAIASSKIYFFDAGVARVLRNEGLISENSPAFGKYLEQIIFLELKARIDYLMSSSRLSFWRSLSQLEVDFLIDDRIAVEVKSTSRVSKSDTKGLVALGEDLKLERKIIVCRDKTYRREDGIEVFHYEDFLKAIWKPDFI